MIVVLPFVISFRAFWLLFCKSETQIQKAPYLCGGWMAWIGLNIFQHRFFEWAAYAARYLGWERLSWAWIQPPQHGAGLTQPTSRCDEAIEAEKPRIPLP